MLCGRRNRITVLDVDAPTAACSGKQSPGTATACDGEDRIGKISLLYRYNGEARRIRPWKKYARLMCSAAASSSAPPEYFFNNGEYNFIAGQVG